MSREHPIVAELAKLQYDLTAFKARVSEIQRQVAALQLVEKPGHDCEFCGLDLQSATKLAEHVYTSHDGPEPEHWTRSEALSVDDDPSASS